jgi:hypothetical protein
MNHCHVCGGADEWEDCSEYKEEGYVFCHRCGCDTVLVDKDFEFWDKREGSYDENI